jgi:hypothetical protein
LEFPRDEIIEVRPTKKLLAIQYYRCQLNQSRLSLRATKMKHAESIFPTCQKRLSPPRPKI